MFLTNMTQFVQLNKNVFSSLVTTNIGAPQGSVLSPVLFTLYTNDCQLNENFVKLIKFADDTTIQGLIRPDNDEETYRNSIETFVNWCQDHNLLLNVKKTKELIIDFRKSKDPLTPLVIKNEVVEQVHSYKYLGVTIDKDLNWNEHTGIVIKKLHSRNFFLRKLNSFGIDKTLLKLFYRSCIESIVIFCIAGWGGNARATDRKKINRVIGKASSVTKHHLPTIESLHNTLVLKKIKMIAKDCTHPLHSQINFNTRSHRPITLRSRTDRYRLSFMPLALKLLVADTPR